MRDVSICDFHMRPEANSSVFKIFKLVSRGTGLVW